MRIHNILAKALLIISYSLCYFLLSVAASVMIWEPLFQVAFHVGFIVFIAITYEPWLAAFVQALGSSRVDSALRRIGGVATLIDNLHEYSELHSLLRYTQTSLGSLFGAGEVTILLRDVLLESTPTAHAQFYRWGIQGSTLLAPDAALLPYAASQQQAFTSRGSPESIRDELAAFHAQLGLPIFSGNRLLALVLLSDPAGSYTELRSMLAFFARQLGIALDRIDAEQQKHFRQEQAFTEKIAALATLSATVAHEMRTPLSGVRASISGVDSYLPELIAAYRFARIAAPEEFPVIRDELLETLTQTGPRVRSMVDQANHVIDLLLVNLNDKALDHERLESCSIQQCVDKALQQYPFKRLEREKIQVNIPADFQFHGVESLLVYVLFNLLKNALYSIESAGKGGISIRAELSENSHTLLFEDTGLGIEQKIQPLIFDGFFSTRTNGTGAGLAFCKRTLLSFGGDIRVTSELGKFTRFTLEFPLPPLNAEIL